MASYYKKFEPFDILNTTVYTEPRINAVSGASGWRSNLGGVSGSVSLYGGLRSRSDVKGNSTSGISIYPLYSSRSTYTIDGCIFKSGSYPITSSIQVVQVRCNTDENSNVTKNDWYKRHYQTIESLYNYYSDRNTDYFTGSYDYYSLYFRQNNSYQAPVVAYTASYLSTMTSSFTVEAWIKPTVVTSSTQDFTIASQRTKWKLYITGTNGKLAFSDFRTILTSSTAIPVGVWSHVLFSSTNTSGTFYINNSSDSQLAFTGTLLSVSASITSSHLAVGAEYTYTAATGSTYTIFGNINIETTFSAAEGVGGPYCEGTLLSSETAGTITHIKYYKSNADVSTSRVVELWSSGSPGILLAYGTSSGEPTGTKQWISASLNTPYPIVSGTQYVASYRTDDFYHRVGASIPVPYINSPLRAHSGQYSSVSGLTSGTPTFPSTNNGDVYFTDIVLSVTSSVPNSSSADQGFSGFIYETKVWDVTRTNAQISSSWNRTLKPTESGSVNLAHYSRFNDGPLSTHHGFSQGSGTFDYSSSSLHGQFINFNTVLPRTPMWQPNDNIDFTTYKTKINDTINMMKIIHIPSIISGRQIVTGSVHLTCRAYDNQNLIRVIRDNGRGGLYISGSMTRAIGNNDEYTGNHWRKVGNVFYSEGLICITDPSMLDFGENIDSHHDDDVFQISFNGLNPVPSTTLLCRIDAGEYNCSHNPTFSYFDPQNPEDITDDRYIVRGDTTWITAIGIYNEERKLVAVAKLASPIRKKINEKLLIKISQDW